MTWSSIPAIPSSMSVPRPTSWFPSGSAPRSSSGSASSIRPTPRATRSSAPGGLRRASQGELRRPGRRACPQPSGERTGQGQGSSSAGREALPRSAPRDMDQVVIPLRRALPDRAGKEAASRWPTRMGIAPPGVLRTGRDRRRFPTDGRDSCSLAPSASVTSSSTRRSSSSRRRPPARRAGRW